MLQESNVYINVFIIQKLESSILYTLNYLLDFEETNSRSFVYFIIYVIVCIFDELIVNQFLYQLQWFRLQIFRKDLHQSSKYKYFYSHRKFDRSDSLHWSKTQNVEKSSRLDQSICFTIFEFQIFSNDLSYHLLANIMIHISQSNFELKFENVFIFFTLYLY